jgi:hypothetical protein
MKIKGTEIKRVKCGGSIESPDVLKEEWTRLE